MTPPNNGSLKVFIVAGGAAVFGKETIALELGDGLRASGVDVSFISSLWCGDGAFGKRLQRLGIPAYFMRLGFISASLRLDSMWWTLDQLLRWPGLMLEFRRLLRREKPPHIIHTNWHHLLLLLPLLDVKRDVFWLHESVPDKPQYRRIFQWLSRRLRCFVPVSHAVAETLRQIGIPEEKIHIIHNGYADPVPREGGRSAHSGVRVAIAGQMSAHKGHEDLVDAFALVATKHPTAELHVFGRGQPEFEAVLKRRVEHLGLVNRVVWRGYVPERITIYQESDILVVPSRGADPLPGVAVEAAFFRLPVVATNRGGLPEIIQDGVTGFLLEAQKPEALAARLDQLVASSELRACLGAAARRRAETHFSRERFVAEITGLLKDGPRPDLRRQRSTS